MTARNNIQILLRPRSTYKPRVPVLQCLSHRVHAVWQWPLSGVHSIMTEKLAQAGGRGGGARCTPTLFHYSYHQVQSCSVLSSWVGRYTHPISSLSYRYVLCGMSPRPNWDPLPPQAIVSLLPEPKVGGPNSDDWRKSLTLCLLVGWDHKW
jgi:hypothetical protein